MKRKERKLVLHDNLSEEKKSEVEKMSKKILAWVKKQGFSRVSITFIGKECHIGTDNEDYINTTVRGTKDNVILDLSFWR